MTKEAVRDVSQHLMRSLHTLLSGLPPLPKATWLSMKLLYREDVTPDDYEPEGFVPAADDKSGLLSFCSQPVELRRRPAGRHGPPGALDSAVQRRPAARRRRPDDGGRAARRRAVDGRARRRARRARGAHRRRPRDAGVGGVVAPRVGAPRRRRDAEPLVPPSDAASVAKFTPAPSSAAPPRRRRRRATRRPCARRSRRSAAASRRSARRRRASRSTRSSRRRRRSRSARRAPPAAAERRESQSPGPARSVVQKFSLTHDPRHGTSTHLA